MKNRTVLSIDLGSAYTKLAIRRDWHDESQLLRELPLATPEVDFCVPSVVTRVETGRATQWLTGAAAATQPPADGVTIYRYWKARLFSEHPEEQASHDSLGPPGEGHDLDDYEEVAVAFFRGLKRSLEREPFALDLANTSVRVCIPKLETYHGAEARIIHILERAGVRPARGRATVYEPESNACGVLTRGRNATWFPPRVSFMPSPGRALQLRDMLEPEGLLEAFRRVSGSFGVLVIDIGGFTTDFGYVKFDTSFSSDDWQRPEIVQSSYELGIRELDHAIYESLGPEAREAVEALSSSEWDAHKARLYRGETVALTRPGGASVPLGKGRGAESIAAAIAAFAQRVTRARDQFREDYVRGPINAQTLTGGGAMIPRIRQALARALSADERIQVSDLLDPDEPRRTLMQRDGHVDEPVLHARAGRNLELVRGGSAIGGSSVFFE
ncbi:MAG: hypothetical protein KY464_06895 [Gemmatimonadetes bacterium]|nr:hypothetical protein [Gemmatimonadota bacterium]